MSNCEVNYRNIRAEEIINDPKYLNIESNLQSNPIQFNFNTNDYNVSENDYLKKIQKSDFKEDLNSEEVKESTDNLILSFYEELENYEKLAPIEMTIEGRGLDRWYNLYKNPQINCIEKFPRIGMNSVLDVLDNHVPCEVTDKMLDGFKI